MDIATLFPKLQKLSKIKINSEKTEKFENEFSNILNFVRLLDEIPLEEIDKEVKKVNILREDIVIKSDLDLNASTNISKSGGYIVPNVLGKVT